MKPISCHQEMGTKKGFCAQEPHRVLLGISITQGKENFRRAVSSQQSSAAESPVRIGLKSVHCFGHVVATGDLPRSSSSGVEGGERDCSSLAREWEVKSGARK